MTTQPPMMKINEGHQMGHNRPPFHVSILFAWAFLLRLSLWNYNPLWFTALLLPRPARAKSTFQDELFLSVNFQLWICHDKPSTRWHFLIWQMSSAGIWLWILRLLHRLRCPLSFMHTLTAYLMKTRVSWAFTRAVVESLFRRMWREL